MLERKQYGSFPRLCSKYGVLTSYQRANHPLRHLSGDGLSPWRAPWKSLVAAKRHLSEKLQNMDEESTLTVNKSRRLPVKKMKTSVRYFAAVDDENINKAESAGVETLSTSSPSSNPVEKKRKSTAAHEGQQLIETHDLSALDTHKIIRKSNKSQLQRRLKTNKKDAKVSFRRQQDPFPGDAPVPKEKMKKYKRGATIDVDGVRTKYNQHKLRQKEKKYKHAVKQAARAELLLHEQAGFIEADEGEETNNITQHEIAACTDLMSAQKFFELKLDQFGPYRLNYTRNGRQLLIGGGRGHIAALDWQTKKLMCEINVMETVQDVKWLHMETMFAVAQKQWCYIYDNQGIELHCLKMLDSVLRLEFLPYHFLLVSGNAKGYLCYVDVSIGKKAAGFPTGLGRLDVMCQNPSNAIIHCGHSGGTVTLWSPNVKEPLVKMLCHGGGTRALAVDRTGQYMATSGVDRTLKIWDLRTYKVMQSYKTGAGAGQLAFSQRGLLAASMGNIVQVYRECCTKPVSSPYLSHQLQGSVQGLQFCPYEDVLGVGYAHGFSSLLIPGAGEPNFDALEANPYQTKKQRQQAEVSMLLEKVQPDMISLDTGALGRMDTKTMKEVMEEKEKLLFLKPQKIDFEPRYKKKGGSKAGKVQQRKQGVQFEHKRKQIQEFRNQKMLPNEDTEQSQQDVGPYSVFDRFKKKE